MLAIFGVPVLLGAATACAEHFLDQFAPPGTAHVIVRVVAMIGLLPAVAAPVWAVLLDEGTTLRRVFASLTVIVAGAFLYVWAAGVCAMLFEYYES